MGLASEFRSRADMGSRRPLRCDCGFCSGLPSQPHLPAVVTTPETMRIYRDQWLAYVCTFPQRVG